MKNITQTTETADPDNATTKQPTALLLDVNALAVLLSRSVPSLRRYDAAGRLPAPVRIGKAVRWRRSEIEQWIAAGCPDRRTWQIMRDDR